MKIIVNKQHIEDGKCGVAQKCMIAAAIKETYPTVTYVAVRTNGITITEKLDDGSSVRSHWSVPTKAARAIISFDHDEPVRPFSFSPKLIDRKALTPRSSEHRASSDKAKEKIRDARKAAGIKEPHKKNLRVAGV